MAFLKALLKMKREQQRETFQSRLTSHRGHAPSLSGVHPQVNPAPMLDDVNDKHLGGGTSSRARHYKPISVPVAKPQIVNAFPKQFILAPPETPISSDFDSEDEEFYRLPPEEDVYNPSMGKFPAGGGHYKQKKTQQQKQFKRFDREYFTFSDMDYEMPAEVREILHEEGFDPSTVESWLHGAEVCHRRALAMRRFQAAKLTKASKKVLPPIKSPNDQPISASPGHGDPEVDIPSRSRSSSPTFGKVDSLPDIVPVEIEGEDETEPKACEEMRRVLTEAEEVKWRCEQQLERMAMPGFDYLPPRLVLISSTVPWCHSLAKVIRREGNAKVLAMVYDFEHWTFQDILDAARDLLDTDCRGCKARSIFMLCKGGPGYFYLLRNYVMTPQKMSRNRYKDVREFWHSIGQLLSKLEPEDAKIHLLGSDLENNYQGRKLIQTIYKAVHPNKTEILCPLENTARGRECLELYFDHRKYSMWRSRPASSYSLYLEHDVTPRSCASMESGEFDGNGAI